MNHYGRAADRDVVLASLAALAAGLRALGATIDEDAAAGAAGAAWDEVVAAGCSW